MSLQTPTTTEPRLCFDRQDISWCVEAIFEERLPRYRDEESSVAEVLHETIASRPFRAAYQLTTEPRLIVDDGTFILNAIEDGEQRRRGDIVGLTLADDEFEVWVSIRPTTSRIIALHEAAHLIKPGDNHGEDWRAAFRALCTARYGYPAADLFDEATSATTVCTHDINPED